MVVSVFILVILTTAIHVHGYALVTTPNRHNFNYNRLDAANSNGNKNNNLGGSIATRGLFQITEWFGQLTNAMPQAASISSPQGLANKRNKKLSALNDIAETIRKEYEAIFWATGNMDTSLWADDCVFSDPFSSFGGVPGSTARFKSNADNLGKLVVNPTLKVTSFGVQSDVAYEGSEEKDKGNRVTTKGATGGNGSGSSGSGSNGDAATDAGTTYDVVKVGWVFSSKLKLPWNPVLAAAGETTHYLNSEGLIVRYEERWKSNAWDVVKRLFVPTSGTSASSSTSA